MYWTSELGNRLNAYNDSVLIDTNLLLKYVQMELLKYEVDESVHLRFEKDSILLETLPKELASEWLPIKMEDDTTVQSYLTNPNRLILIRMGMVLSLTVVVLLFIGLSFFTLIKFANQQKRLSQLKDDFIDNVSHELITPVSTLKLAIESLKTDQTLSSNKYLQISEQQTSRIENVVDQVLKTSFGVSKQAIQSFEEIPLKELILEIISYYETTSAKEVAFNFTPNESDVIYFDRDHLTNILHNVISNAIKYGPESTVKIKIETKVDNGYLKIVISDNGSGIPKSDHDLIFEKFHRITKDTHDVKGLGIGLYYTREVLNKLGGEIKLISSSDKGSTFEISIPKRTHLT